MERAKAKALLDRLHQAQNDFYAGGDSTPLLHLLLPEVRWVVPGENAIAGSYRGIEQVVDYFRRRRDLAAGTFRMRRRDILTGDANRLAALTDGTATIAGHEHHWSTVGLYDVSPDERIAACWLLPLNQREFDFIWSR